jgi:hypothetical protein
VLLTVEPTVPFSIRTPLGARAEFFERNAQLDKRQREIDNARAKILWSVLQQDEHIDASPPSQQAGRAKSRKQSLYEMTDAAPSGAMLQEYWKDFSDLPPSGRPGIGLAASSDDIDARIQSLRKQSARLENVSLTAEQRAAEDEEDETAVKRTLRKSARQMKLTQIDSEDADDATQTMAAVGLMAAHGSGLMAADFGGGGTMAAGGTMASGGTMATMAGGDTMAGASAMAGGGWMADARHMFNDGRMASSRGLQAGRGRMATEGLLATGHILAESNIMANDNLVADTNVMSNDQLLSTYERRMSDASHRSRSRSRSRSRRHQQRGRRRRYQATAPRFSLLSQAPPSSQMLQLTAPRVYVEEFVPPWRPWRHCRSAEVAQQPESEAVCLAMRLLGERGGDGLGDADTYTFTPASAQALREVEESMQVLSLLAFTSARVQILTPEELQMNAQQQLVTAEVSQVLSPLNAAQARLNLERLQLVRATLLPALGVPTPRLVGVAGVASVAEGAEEEAQAPAVMVEEGGRLVRAQLYTDISNGSDGGFNAPYDLNGGGQDIDNWAKVSTGT